MKPQIIEGNIHSDQRGDLRYNNAFDATEVKRIYIIENKDTSLIRGWQGHKIEQRWFSALAGNFEIKLIKIDDWQNPSQELKPYVFLLDSNNLKVLHIPAGYVSSIKALDDNSKLLVMADYKIGEIQDEYRYDINHFKN
ncbi:WxcM-like domain-containing protein [Flavobacterium sp. NRK1]|uniref:WxcM-like domain-containing protein n=1 Tax=Flavobacterium sp. NRK1 TaxID=2954929 RepID=UPI00209300DB|nr:WxcM-like domain-containing protein [Flavobacterium sp. NRK1]MCO6146886.1 WxcM-like domain-containing protein [Flavobacterium sp. NRK1]